MFYATKITMVNFYWLDFDQIVEHDFCCFIREANVHSTILDRNEDACTFVT